MQYLCYCHINEAMQPTRSLSRCSVFIQVKRWPDLKELSSFKGCLYTAYRILHSQWTCKYKAVWRRFYRRRNRNLHVNTTRTMSATIAKSSSRILRDLFKRYVQETSFAYQTIEDSPQTDSCCHFHNKTHSRFETLMELSTETEFAWGKQLRNCTHRRAS